MFLKMFIHFYNDESLLLKLFCLVEIKLFL